jgi:hypothetical protein
MAVTAAPSNPDINHPHGHPSGTSSPFHLGRDIIRETTMPSKRALSYAPATFSGYNIAPYPDQQRHNPSTADGAFIQGQNALV